MEEPLLMLERGLLFWTWSTPKFGSAALLLLLIWGWRLVAQARIQRTRDDYFRPSKRTYLVHGVIMILVWAFLLFISIHGIATRGVFGTLYTEPHGAFYKHIAFLHLGSGAVYFVLGLAQIVSTSLGQISHFRPLLRYHKGVGEAALTGAIISIACLFFLK